MSLDKQVLKEYRRSRGLARKKYLCNAPFGNMYFNIHGDAAPCWLGFINPESYPERSIREIWDGARFNTFRNNIKKHRLEETCATCLHNLSNKNYVSVLARAYDHLRKPSKYPRMMELELDNTCNLECIMCHGFLSSSIRKNREHKPPLHIPYDDNFVDQLNEFIPHLQEIRINGGEPFLSPICRKIFENSARLNSGLKLVVATNGTVLNPAIEAMLEKGQFHINISIDSLVKETYETIRVHAVFEKTMANFEYFLKYCRRKGTKLCLMVNPMRENWREMPEFVLFCNKHNIPLWFNTIQQPEDHSLWALPAENLVEIYETLSANQLKPSVGIPESFHNARVFHNLVHTQIYNWLQESKINKQTIVGTQTNHEQLFYEQISRVIKRQISSETSQQDQMLLIESKIEELQQTGENPLLAKSDFFKLASQLPAEMVYQELSTKSVAELRLLIEKFMK
ncbi:MAG TPA: radical SAM protein [Bacteroidales bacterium]|nr:radical SAM protein [Bacteroidales bacterium]